MNERGYGYENISGAELRQFPADTQAESLVLSSMLYDMPTTYELYGRRLKPEIWHDPLNKLIGEAMVDMHVSAIEVHVVSVTDWLRQKGELDKVGGPARITELLGAMTFSSGALAGYSLGILEGMAARRMLLRQSDALKLAALDYTQDWKDCLMQAEAALFDVHNKSSHEGMVPIKKLVKKAVEEIQQTVFRKGHVTSGVATGMTTFDRMTMGLKAGLHFIAARPSKGKTTILLQMALNMAMGLGDYPEFDQPPLEVGIFSLETDGVALTKRALLNLAKINLQKCRDGNISRAALQDLVDKAQKLTEANIFIEACYGLSIQDLRSRLRMLVKRFRLKIIFIDYLQLMTSASRRAKDNRQLEIAEISLGLKQAAGELGIPIVCLAQLNRDGDVARPKLSHLRESGQVEQDADSVSMICEPPERVSENDPEDCPWTYMGLDILKQKDGPTTTDGEPIALRFDKEFFRLTSIDEKLYSNNPDHRQGAPRDHEGEPRDKSSYDREKRPRGRPRKDGQPPGGGGGGRHPGMDEIFPEEED